MSFEKPIKTNTASQALASAALLHEVVFGASPNDKEENVELLAVMIKASVNITETITVSHVGVEGANYTFVLDTASLSTQQNYVFRPTGHCVFKRGDTLRVACTNANTTGTVYSKVQYREDI